MIWTYLRMKLADDIPIPIIYLLILIFLVLNQLPFQQRNKKKMNSINIPKSLISNKTMNKLIARLIINVKIILIIAQGVSG